MKKYSIQKKSNIQFKENKFVQFNEIKYVHNSMIFFLRFFTFKLVSTTKLSGGIVIKINWLGNLEAFFVLCFCSLFSYCYMTLTLQKLQKALRCKWANGQCSNEPSHLELKIITVPLHTTWNKAAIQSS